MTTTEQAERFEFDGYTLRPVGESDRALLESFIAAEPAHVGRVTPDFYIGRAYALEDPHGYVLLYMRNDVVARVHMEFRQSHTPEERKQMAAALINGFAWLAQKLVGNGFTEMVFDSQAPLLRLFATHRLGFEAAPFDLRRGIAASDGYGRRVNDWQPVPQTSQAEA